MARRGPQPTPTPILKARGSWRAADRERAGEPRPEVKAPGCPTWLSTEAKAEWRRQVKLLEAIGCIAELDRAALAAWCEAWAEFVDAVAAIEKGDDEKGNNKGRIMVGSAGNLVVSPYVRIKQHAVDRMLKIAAQFGFTPAARSRIRAADQGEEHVDPFQEFLNRNRA